MEISYDTNAGQVAFDLKETLPNETPYAVAVMLTRLVGDLSGGFASRLPSVFDRPTDFTLRSFYTKGASKSSLEAIVYVPQSQDDQGKSTREYMRPEAMGTPARHQKRTEYLLTRIGALPPGWVTTPGRGAELDAHGNLPGSVYRQIINVLQIRYNSPKPVSQRSQKAAARLGVAALFFVVAPGKNQLGKNGGWLPPGVWKHLPGHRITQVLKFVSRASYKPRFNMATEAAPILRQQIPVRWAEAAALIRAKFSRPRT
jgi:hypothetical protein